MGRMTGSCLLVVLGLVVASPGRAQTDDSTRGIRERDLRDHGAGEAHQAGEEKPAGRDRLALIHEADALIRDQNYSGKSSAHYKVQTDDPRLSPAAAAHLLESFRSYFQGYWEGELLLEPYEESSRVYLFYSYFKYNRVLTGEDRFDPLRTAGHYRAFFDVVVVHTDSVPGGLADVLVHEAAHQLAAQQIFGAVEGEAPPWLSEGLASYFGFTFQGPESAFQPGVIGGKSAAIFPDARRTQAGNAWEWVKELRKGWKKGQTWPLDALLSMGPAAFYDDSAQQHYAAAWMLVHFLLHGEGGGRREGFVRFLQDARRGDADAEVLYRDLGVSERDLARGFTDHVRGLKPRMRRQR